MTGKDASAHARLDHCFYFPVCHRWLLCDQRIHDGGKQHEHAKTIHPLLLVEAGRGWGMKPCEDTQATRELRQCATWLRRNGHPLQPLDRSVNELIRCMTERGRGGQREYHHRLVLEHSERTRISPTDSHSVPRVRRRLSKKIAAFFPASAVQDDTGYFGSAALNFRSTSTFAPNMSVSGLVYTSPEMLPFATVTSFSCSIPDALPPALSDPE